MNNNFIMELIQQDGDRIIKEIEPTASWNVYEKTDSVFLDILNVKRVCNSIEFSILFAEYFPGRLFIENDLILPYKLNIS